MSNIKSHIRAVLFDMDGVLVDAREWHYEALNGALAIFGMRIDRESHLSTFDGLSTKQKLKILSENRQLPQGLHKLINDIKQRITHDIMVARCRPVFHHRYLLSRLKKEGFVLAMCSNSVRQSVDLVARHAGLSPYLSLILSNEDVQNPKPSPEIYQKAMKQLGVLPQECLIVEDNDNGVLAARESGAYVHVVSSPDEVHYQAISRAIEAIHQKQGAL
jgi:HAD superfamily hydrolase (TIGR01509 family)